MQLDQTNRKAANSNTEGSTLKRLNSLDLTKLAEREIIIDGEYRVDKGIG
jgi:hypothetical protein